MTAERVGWQLKGSGKGIAELSEKETEIEASTAFQLESLRMYFPAPPSPSPGQRWC